MSDTAFRAVLPYFAPVLGPETGVFAGVIVPRAVFDTRPKFCRRVTNSTLSISGLLAGIGQFFAAYARTRWLTRFRGDVRLGNGG
jgi:hypothetical protein